MAVPARMRARPQTWASLQRDASSSTSTGRPLPVAPSVGPPTSVGGADGAEPVVPVSRTVVLDDPANAILEASKHADLLVGSRGLGPDGNADLGAVADRVIREARCPVVVVPAE